MHISSGHSFAIYCYFHNQNISFVEQGAWKKVALLFNGATRQLHCVHTAFVPVFQCHILKRHRPIDRKCNFFFLAPDFINSVISQYNGKCGQ